MKLLRDLFTDAQDNWEWASIQGAAAFAAFMIIAFYHYIWLGNTFDPLAFGSGTGAIAAATGAHKIMSNKGDEE